MFSVRIKRVVKIDGKRPYNKKLSCYYCGKLLHHRIQKPLENSHNNELLVAQATAKISIKERDVLFNKIKNLGNFKHNINVIIKEKES